VGSRANSYIATGDLIYNSAFVISFGNVVAEKYLLNYSFMIFSLILGLALFAVSCYLVLLFFQVHKVEKQISDLILTVEIHLLNKYGHNPNRNVRYVDVKKAMAEAEE
jgi:uncharacterized protein (DUF58 family)